MDLPQEHTFESRLRQNWPPENWCDLHVVLAVSGGPDSVAMLRAMNSIKERCGGTGNLVVAHFNHGFRGLSADADQNWLEELCRTLALRLVEGKVAELTAAENRGDGWEAAARAARYRFLCKTAEKLGARFVAVAHHADDQVETVLHRILRGTGLDGLAGIPRHRPLSPSVTLVRPLLNVNRTDVLQYLADLGQDFRTDETNVDTHWTRNRLRHELLPMLRQQYNRGIDDALTRLAAQSEEAQQLIVDLAEKVVDECVSREVVHRVDSSSDVIRVRIDCRRVSESPLPVVREVCRITWQQADWPLQAMGFDQWQQLAELAVGRRSGPVNLPENIRARRENGALLLEPLD